MQERQIVGCRTFRFGLMLCAALLLSACERTRFSEAPADATGCNPALVGDWLNEADEDSALGEIAASVDGSCQLRVTENDKSPPRLSPPTTLRSARVGERDLLWIDAAWADAAFEIEADAITPTDDDAAHDVYLFAWHYVDDRLTLTAPDPAALAHAAIDGELKADVLHGDYDLHVRVREPQAKLQSLLASGKVFGGAEDDAKSLRFVRADVSGK